MVAAREVEDGVPGDEGVERPARVGGPHVAEDEVRPRHRNSGEVEHPGGPVETGDGKPAAGEVHGDRLPAPTADVEDAGAGREWGHEAVDERPLPERFRRPEPAGPPGVGDPVVGGGHRLGIGHRANLTLHGRPSGHARPDSASTAISSFPPAAAGWTLIVTGRSVSAPGLMSIRQPQAGPGGAA